mgnify:CR=1 FL=1
MAKALTLENALSSDRKPIKIDGESTGLLVGGKDVHIEGESTVGGDLTVDGDLTINGGNITNAITLDSTLAVTGDTTLTGTLAVNGDTITTDGNATLDSGGSLALDSQTGRFLAKKAGTEFSVAYSAYAGMILGYTTVGIDAADDSYTLDTTMTVPDDALKVKFVAPPSGVVEIMAQIYFDPARRAPVLGLSDRDASAGYRAISFPNATDVTNEHLQAVPPSLLGDHMLRPHWVVTGLTSGTAYEWWIGAKLSLGTGGVLRWGGNVTNEYPPFIMKATALPSATTDYAVYG